MANRTSNPDAICYTNGSDFSEVKQVLEEGLAQNYTGLMSAILYLRTTAEQTDALAVFKKNVLGGPNKDLPRSQIEIFLDDAEASFPIAGDYWWNCRIVKRGASRSAQKVDGDVTAATAYESLGATFQADGVVAGDFLVITTGTNAGSYLIATIPSETTLTIDSFIPFPDPTEGAGQTFEVFVKGDVLKFPERPAPFEIVGGGA